MRNGSPTLIFFKDFHTQACLLKLRPKVVPKGFAWSFSPTKFCFTVLCRVSCPIASVPEVLAKGGSPEHFSSSFFWMRSCPTGFGSTGSIPAFFLSQVLFPKSLLPIISFQRLCFIWSQGLAQAHEVRRTVPEHPPIALEQLANSFRIFHEQTVDFTRNCCQVSDTSL